MSDTLGTYSFLPWLRLGMANRIGAPDGDAAVKTRATVRVDLALTGTAVEGDTDVTATVGRDVALYGPGDIIGIDPRAVVKVEPRHWITNFEPNYLAHIEFYDEDFPWRYTPAAPDPVRHRLRPWLALVVLQKDEFREVPVAASRPLPAIEITRGADELFPPADQLWAWAHVHVNRDLVQADGVVRSTDAELTRGRLEAALSANPDHGCSRILSPRKLLPDVGYHAFLVPSFETGRLAGLGLAEAMGAAPVFATLSAWADYAGRPSGTLYPVYHRWFFKTGTVGDFEQLVRLLVPRPADARLGRRDMDVQDPGSALPAIDGNPDLGGVLRLGGALQVPKEALSDGQEAEAQAFEDWDTPYPQPFQEALADFVNLPDDYVRDGAPDPVIVPPIYGRWHALTDRLLREADGAPAPHNDNWLHELNLDPRFRAPAAFGTKVVQDKQEDYMDAAWGQVGEILEANRRIRLAQFARETAAIWHARHLGPIRARATERALAMMAPVQRRVLDGDATVYRRLATSTVPRAALSVALRRMLRPRDHLAATLGFASADGAKGLIDRINRGEVSPAPPRITPDALPTVEEVADDLAPPGVPAPGLELLRRYPWLVWLLPLLVLLLALLLLPVSLLLGSPVAFAAAGLFAWLRRTAQAAALAAAVTPEGASAAMVDALPPFPGFVLRDPVPGAAEPAPAPGTGTDSAEAARFKLALKDMGRVLEASRSLGTPPVRQPLDLRAVTSASFAAINPDISVPAFVGAQMVFPAHIIAQNPEGFREAMAYPVLDVPMYKPLLDISDQHFLPNIDKIPQNTITVLETNQRFIEAYMVGVNHEFARELLWREYPTDQRGTPFRQFWDPAGVIDREGLSKDALSEKLRDIPPIHEWSLSSKLGDHDHRERSRPQEEDVVLVIRGELLKKYPTAVIYAQKARWQLDAQGKIDRRKERILETDGSIEDRLRTPLYEAKVDPDITFLGFDLTTKEVKGGSGLGTNTAPGWFFVIKERPGEPRFGLDVSRDGDLNVWNDLAWPDVSAEADIFLQIVPGGATLTLEKPVAADVQEKLVQWEEDRGLTWSPDTNAAELAYILYQVPVLVAVHGSEMLPD